MASAPALRADSVGRLKVVVHACPSEQAGPLIRQIARLNAIIEKLEKQLARQKQLRRQDREQYELKVLPLIEITMDTLSKIRDAFQAGLKSKYVRARHPDLVRPPFLICGIRGIHESLLPLLGITEDRMIFHQSSTTWYRFTSAKAFAKVIPRKFWKRESSRYVNGSRVLVKYFIDVSADNPIWIKYMHKSGSIVIFGRWRADGVHLDPITNLRERRAKLIYGLIPKNVPVLANLKKTKEM
jgi:hypothetical protein